MLLGETVATDSRSGEQYYIHKLYLQKKCSKSKASCETRTSCANESIIQLNVIKKNKILILVFSVGIAFFRFRT